MTNANGKTIFLNQPCRNSCWTPCRLKKRCSLSMFLQIYFLGISGTLGSTFRLAEEGHQQRDLSLCFLRCIWWYHYHQWHQWSDVSFLMTGFPNFFLRTILFIPLRNYDPSPCKGHCCKPKSTAGQSFRNSRININFLHLSSLNVISPQLFFLPIMPGKGCMASNIRLPIFMQMSVPRSPKLCCGWYSTAGQQGSAAPESLKGR